MGLTNTQYDTIMRDYQRQQARDHDEHARRQAEIYEKIPEFAQIDAQIAAASTACARRMLLDGGAASSASEKNAAGENSSVLHQLRQTIDLEQKLGDPTPSEVTVELKGKEYQALLTDQETGLKRGTSATSGVRGTVIYYSLAGYGEFTEDISLPVGSVCYFSFADEEHCATWKHQRGWSGDSYE